MMIENYAVALVNIRVNVIDNTMLLSVMLSS